jgi:hypothetical protein
MCVKAARRVGTNCDLKSGWELGGFVTWLYRCTWYCSIVGYTDEARLVIHSKYQKYSTAIHAPTGRKSY